MSGSTCEKEYDELSDDTNDMDVVEVDLSPGLLAGSPPYLPALPLSDGGTISMTTIRKMGSRTRKSPVVHNTCARRRKSRGTRANTVLPPTRERRYCRWTDRLNCGDRPDRPDAAIASSRSSPPLRALPLSISFAFLR